MNDEIEILYRPVGPIELQLIIDSGWTCFPPRLPEQPIFYPVLNRQYAIQIARDWNLPRSGAGFVVKFQIRKKYIEQFEVRVVGNREHQEYWIPAGELDVFNENILGKIELIDEFLG